MKAYTTLILILYSCMSGRAQTAQNSDDLQTKYGIAYRHALEDSLLKFEKIKTTHHQLKIVHELQLQENNLLKKELQFKELSFQLSEQEYQRRFEEQAKIARKHFLKGFKIGAITGVALVVGVRLITN